SQLIAKSMRLDTPNPQKAWQEHQELLQSRVDYLNSANFKALRYKNSLGTDFYIELPQNYIFIGGSELSKGRVFTANMPFLQRPNAQAPKACLWRQCRLFITAL